MSDPGIRFVTRSLLYLFACIALAALLTGCATPTQWQTWREHETHFASSEHMAFSLKPTPCHVQRFGPFRIVPDEPGPCREGIIRSWWGEEAR